MNDVEYIEHGGQRFVLVPEATWEHLKGHIEQLLDYQAKASGAPAAFARPILVQAAISAGSSELRAWRRYRGLHGEQLAQRVGVSRAYISMIEAGRRTPGADLLRRLADALDIPVSALVASHGPVPPAHAGTANAA